MASCNYIHDQEMFKLEIGEVHWRLKGTLLGLGDEAVPKLFV